MQTSQPRQWASTERDDEMSDAAFKTAAYPGYTTEQLREWAPSRPEGIRRQMENEIERRAKRDAGDVSVMTDGERLRRARGQA